MQVIAFADESSIERRSICIDLPEIWLHAAKVDGRHFARLRAHLVVLLPPFQEYRYVLHRGAALLNGHRIFERKRLALALFLGAPAVVRALLEARDERRVRAVLLDVLLDLRVEAGYEGGHEHDHAHAEHDSKHGETA